MSAIVFIKHEGMHIHNNKMFEIKGSSKDECIKCTIFIEEHHRKIILFTYENTENLLWEKYHDAHEKQ